MNRSKFVAAATLVTFAYSLFWLFMELVAHGDFVRDGSGPFSLNAT